MKRFVSVFWIVFVMAFLYLPVLLLAVYSFTDSALIGVPGKFSLHNYITLFKMESLRNMIGGTLLLALVVAFLSTALGTLGAIGGFYSGKRTRQLMGSINQVPVVNADVVTGFSICILMIVFLKMDKETYIPMVIGLISLCAPFVYLSVMPRLRQMDPQLYEAALDLGCTQRQALIRVVLPQISPGILSGFMLSITLSLDDYFITTYTKPATFDTISTYVVNATRGAQTNVKTALWALSTLMFLVVVLIVILSNRKGNVNEDK